MLWRIGPICGRFVILILLMQHAGNAYPDVLKRQGRVDNSSAMARETVNWKGKIEVFFCWRKAASRLAI